ncbi:MAG: glycosyl hydrolase family 8 [Cytophagales bacterium]
MHLLLLFITAICPNLVFSQNWPANIIDVNINSGNPRYPFPQFTEYNSGRSLAKHNPIGVVHAEMEQTIRDAYRIMMNRAIYTGTVLNPGTAMEVRYITFNENVVPHNYGTFVSEGDGYALLAAAYMCDKKTFDGLWCWMHDNRLSVVKRYINCADLRPTYAFGPYTFGWNNNATTPAGSGNNDAASDGDFDVGLALLMAYRQWGEHSGIIDACGEEINYRKEALHFIKAMVDTTYWDNGSGGFSAGSGHLTGNIGIDGYVKSGNTWGELTGWRLTAPAPYTWANAVPSPLQVTGRFFDYFAPGYFRAFGDFLLEQITNTDVPVNNFHSIVVLRLHQIG